MLTRMKKITIIDNLRKNSFNAFARRLNVTINELALNSFVNKRSKEKSSFNSKNIN